MGAVAVSAGIYTRTHPNTAAADSGVAAPTPNLGVDPAPLKGKVDHFFHLAAIYDMTADDEVNEKLKGIMVKAFQEVLSIARRDQVDMRTAAYLLAVQRVADATSMRGLYP